MSCSCFVTALEKSQGEAVGAMHNLSMLLRQKRAPTPEERKALIMESIELAKRVRWAVGLKWDCPHHSPSAQALKQDLTNGHSWFILGNAYMAMFFGFSLDTAHLQQVRVEAASACAEISPRLTFVGRGSV